MPNENNGMKYEGLVALMLGIEERINTRNEERHKEFKDFVDHRFTKVDEHNEWQNGSMQKMAERVHTLEHEQAEIKNGNRYVRLLKWIDTHPRRSIALVLISWSVASIAVTNAVCNNWVPRLWEIIVRVVT